MVCVKFGKRRGFGDRRMSFEKGCVFEKGSFCQKRSFMRKSLSIDVRVFDQAGFDRRIDPASGDNRVYWQSKGQSEDYKTVKN